jgi:peptidoglycan/LPS O-acetylase OafA/YrhL
MREHFKSIDILRGLASLAVVLAHFSNNALPVLQPNPLGPVFVFGLNGVQVFFVISGFIIPYSLTRSGYALNNFFPYMSKRFLRICPVSYVAMFLSIALHFLAIYLINRPIRGEEWPGMGFPSLISNATYTSPYFKIFYFNPVVWTLLIEFQFYILIGIALPFLLKQKKEVVFCCLCVLLIFFQLPFLSFFSYGSYFVLGMTLFFYGEKLLDAKLHFLLLTFALAVALYSQGIRECCAGLIAVLFLKYVKSSNRVLVFLGRISFSLYLSHLFFGFCAEIVTKKMNVMPESEFSKACMLFVYVLGALIFASAFYWLIEKPFTRLSQKIKWEPVPKYVSAPGI